MYFIYLFSDRFPCIFFVFTYAVSSFCPLIKPAINRHVDPRCLECKVAFKLYDGILHLFIDVYHKETPRGRIPL